MSYNSSFSEASSTSTSDSSALPQRTVHGGSADDDSFFNVIGDLDSTPSAMNSQTDLPWSLEQDMSETRLRQMYDEEEVERFLYLFSAYVTEVRLPGASVSTECVTTESPNGSSPPPKPPALPPRPFTRVSEGGTLSAPLPPPLPLRPVELSWSEQIAHNHILPILPPAPPPAPPFTLKRLQLTSQRLFLAVAPPYQAFFLSMTDLALWKDPQRSGLYCVGFWVLWLHDLLLPALIVRILWEMLSRKFFPYPTLETLQMRRKDSESARKFGEKIQERLMTSSMGPMETFRLWKSAAKNKIKAGAKDAGASPSGNGGDTDNEKTATALDEDSEEEQDIKRELLHLLNIIADIHERIKNVFMWRRPAVSKKCAMILAIMFFCTLIIPAQYLAKLIYGVCGISFWHIPPVLSALPPGARARLPALFGGAPTDADYAIEIIAQRIARGEEINPPRRGKHHDHARSPFASEVNLSQTVSVDASSRNQPQSHDGVDWKKWGTRVAQGKSLIEEGKQLLSRGPVHRGISSPQRSLDLTSTNLQEEEIHTFPAHHTSAPGLITLTATMLYFTALTSRQAKIIIPYGSLCGVKKNGLMKGLLITWIDSEKGREREIEEKFHWVGNRDELFARLLGPDGTRWMRI